MEDLKGQWKAQIDDLPTLFGQLKEALLPSAPAVNEILQLEVQHNSALQEWLGGRQRKEEADLVINRVREAVLVLIDGLSPTDLKEGGTAKTGLGDYHAHTCDRVDQSDHFNKIFAERKKKKTHFFYLYGLDLQSHQGIFKRIAFDLEGRLSDYLNQGMETGVRSLQVELTFDVSHELEVYKQNVLKNFFASLNVRVNEYEPLAQKNISWLREHSPLLQNLGGQDYVCILVRISEWDWDKDITPEVVRWFISEFCSAKLPDDSPAYLFFFAIIYEEDDSPVEDEVVAALTESEHVKNGSLTVLPELQMVGRRDIGAWFNKYNFIAPGARELKELREKHFGSSPEHYMTDVERTLRQLIDSYNDKR